MAPFITCVLMAAGPWRIRWPVCHVCVDGIFREKAGPVFSRVFMGFSSQMGALMVSFGRKLEFLMQAEELTWLASQLSCHLFFFGLRNSKL